MKGTYAVLIGSVALVAGLVYVLASGDSRPGSDRSPGDSSIESTAESGKNEASGTQQGALLLYCAASNRKPIEAVCKAYEEEFGRRVDVQFGSSQSLLSSLKVSGTGDLFLPADDSYIEIAKSQQLVEEVLPLARMNVVIAVKRGNPKNITNLDDLLREDVSLVQADPETTAIGKVVKQHLTSTNRWDAIHQSTTAYRTTIADAANDVVIGAADVAFSYDAFLGSYDKLEAVKVTEFEALSSPVSVSIAACSKQPQQALHFARFLSARDRGLELYKAAGFETVMGDVWADVPELTVFAGSMLRPAIEETIVKFEEREGVRVTRVYNGCGILVGQMQAGQTPDVYFACDKEFMEMVPDLFPESVDVSQNELVILVQKGNPHNIVTLRDLGNGGLRVGIGHEKLCAMGWLTQNTLKEGGVQQEVMENVTVQTPTGDMLVNQLLTGSLDAAVVYLSNAAGAAGKLDAIQIQGLDCAVAVQPYAIRTGSPNAQTASRLFAAINRPESYEIFEAEGFRLKSKDITLTTSSDLRTDSK